MPGTYTVSVVAPAGYVATKTGQGTAATDSNASPSGTTPSFLQSGGSDQTIDFGFYQPVSIGNFVWNDLNRNGIQETGEPGIAGVTVNLLDSSSKIIATTTTDATGYYEFAGLAPGTYQVTRNIPVGYTPTLVYAPGSTPANDSNDNPDGNITLASGGSDQTIDFGFYQTNTKEDGRTIGYYTNKNGQNDLKANWNSIWTNLFGSSGALVHPDKAGYTVLVGSSGYVPLSSFSGSNGYTFVKNYLLNATATNMAYMLSAQLLAMEFNVFFGRVTATDSISVSATGISANLQHALTVQPVGAKHWTQITTVDGGVASIQSILNAAIEQLRYNPNTVASGGNRTYQEALKCLLDAMNNNMAIFIH